MESWKKGRDDLLEKIASLYNEIGESIASELNDESFTRISKEELKSLRQTSANIQKIVERNDQLSDELEIYRAAAARVGSLEKANKRLAQELQDKLQQQATPIVKPISRIQQSDDLDATPGPSEPPSSYKRIEYDDSKPVDQRMHQSLVRKYNIMCDSYSLIRGRHKKTEEAFLEHKSKNEDWNLWKESTQKILDRKSNKIQRQEEEMRRLRALVKDLGGDPEKGLGTIGTPKAAEGAGDRPRLVRDDSEVQVPASSPPRGVQSSKYKGEHGTAGSKGGRPSKDLKLQLPPCHNDTDVAEAEFEPSEAHSTSSTQGGSDIISPQKFPDEVFEHQVQPALEAITSVVFVSSKKIKKRKRPNEVENKSPCRQVKIEISSSSPVGLAGMNADPNDSMDLDEIGNKTDTPRKQRHFSPLSRQVSRLGKNSQDSKQSRGQSQRRNNASNSSTSDSPSEDTPISRRTASILQPRSTNKQILPRTSDERTSKKRRVASDQDLGGLIEDGEIAATGVSSRQTSTYSAHLVNLLDKPSPAKTILSPLQSTRPMNRALQFGRPTHRNEQPGRLPVTSGLTHELEDTVLEGAEALKVTRVKMSKRSSVTSRESLARTNQEPFNSVRPSSRSSILSPLKSSKPPSGPAVRCSGEPPRPSSTGPSRHSEEPSDTDERMARRSPSIDSTQLPPRRDLQAIFSAKSKPRTPVVIAKPSPRPSAASSKPGTANKNQARANKPFTDFEMDSDQEPLRARPVNMLSVSDFKINPSYNQGKNYAFSEVVRGEARKCLQGCTKPECCGHKFRALAEMELERRAQHVTLSQEERDDLLLEDFLGDNAHKIRTLGRTEREELLAQATTRQMANQYGKHRFAYERRSTPPGFWNVDFPTTQEDLEDREKANKKEREIVEQRYKQAMRPGGAYIFRDENP